MYILQTLTLLFSKTISILEFSQTRFMISIHADTMKFIYSETYINILATKQNTNHIFIK